MAADRPKFDSKSRAWKRRTAAGQNRKLQDALLRFVAQRCFSAEQPAAATSLVQATHTLVDTPQIAS